jgi:hypothetical protein
MGSSCDGCVSISSQWSAWGLVEVVKQGVQAQALFCDSSGRHDIALEAFGDAVGTGQDLPEACDSPLLPCRFPDALTWLSPPSLLAAFQGSSEETSFFSFLGRRVNDARSENFPQ